MVAALVVKLPFCSSPAACRCVPAVAGQGHRLPGRVGSADDEAAGRGVPRPGGARDRGCRLPRRVPDRGRNHLDDAAAGQRGAVRAETAPDRETGPAAGQRRPAGHLRPIAVSGTWAGAVISVYGHDTTVQITVIDALWHGSFKTAPGRVVLVRAPDSGKPCDLALFTLDTQASPAAIAERYSWRWAIKPSNATGKQILGVGDACNRAEKAVERTVPFGFLIQSLLVCWYTLSAYDPADIDRRPGYARGTAPRRPRHPPTCSPGSAASSPKPDFPPSGQATTATIKPTWMPGPATAPPPNSETRGASATPEKRKVDSSILSLTTSEGCFCTALTSGNAGRGHGRLRRSRGLR